MEAQPHHHPPAGPAPAAAPGSGAAVDDGAHHHQIGPAANTYDLRWLDVMVQHHTGALRMMGSMPTLDNRVTWFLEGMLAHHGGALEIAHDAFRKSRNPSFLRLARQIIVAQRCDILELRRLLRHEGLSRPEDHRFDALFSF